MRPSERFGPDPIIWDRKVGGRIVSTGDGRFEIDRGWDDTSSRVCWRLFDGGVLVARDFDLDDLIRTANRIRNDPEKGGTAEPKPDGPAWTGPLGAGTRKG